MIPILVKDGRGAGAKNKALNDDVWHYQTNLTLVWGMAVML